MKRLFRKMIISAMLCLSLTGACFAAAGFLVTEKDGMVAVWDCDQDLWLEITDTPVSSLPLEDRRAIHPGILCENQAEASKYLEDFSG